MKMKIEMKMEIAELVIIATVKSYRSIVFSKSRGRISHSPGISHDHHITSHHTSSPSNSTPIPYPLT